MIDVEGFKAFRGTMKISPKPVEAAPFELTGDWLYMPLANCWYGRGRSFPADICTVVEDTTGPSGLAAEPDSRKSP